MRKLASFAKAARMLIIFGMVSLLVFNYLPFVDAASPAHLCQFPTAYSSTHEEINPDGSNYGTTLDETKKYDGTFSVSIYHAAKRDVVYNQGFFDDTDYSAYDQMNVAIDNASITDMWISVVMKWSSGAESYNGSFGRQFRLGYYMGASSNSSTHFDPFTNSTANYTTPWTSVNAVTGGVHDEAVIYQWHIWPYVQYDISAYKLQRYGLIATWEGFDYATTDSQWIKIDYLGIYYAWVEDITWQQGDYQSVMMGLIWLLIVFFPGIALNSAFPMIGFGGGLILMTVLIGIADSGFIPVTVMAFIAVGILYLRN